MTDNADDLILQMQHLAAGARAAEKARASQLSADKLKTAALKVAGAAQLALDEAQRKLSEGEEMLARAKLPGADPREAGELHLQGRLLVEKHKPEVIKARAKLNFALDAMDESDRRAWDALQADAQAEAHSQLAGVAPAAPAAGEPDPTKGA